MPSAVSISLTASSLAHSAGPASVPSSQPFGSISSVVGMPNALADRLEVLEHLRARIGIVAEPLDADLVQPGLRLVEVARVDVDRDHLELRRRRASPAARRAPASPCGTARTTWPTGSTARSCPGSRRASRGLPSASVKASSGRRLGSVAMPSAATSPRASGSSRRPARPPARHAASAALRLHRADPVYRREPDARRRPRREQRYGEPASGSGAVGRSVDVIRERRSDGHEQQDVGRPLRRRVPTPIMEEINASIDFDRQLYRQDIAARKAHAAMLAQAGHHRGATMPRRSLTV